MAFPKGKTAAIIQSRLGSTRFPRKAFAIIDGKSMITHVIERVRGMTGVDIIALAVPEGDFDEYVRMLSQDNVFIHIIGHSEGDVLGRYEAVATMLGLEPTDAVVRITGDCPMFDPRIGDLVVTAFWADTRRNLSIWSNDTRVSGYPDGFDCEVFTAGTLRKAEHNATYEYDREHVTTWMYRHLTSRVVRAEAGSYPSGVKLSVDTLQDYERVKEILERRESYWVSSTRQNVELPSRVLLKRGETWANAIDTLNTAKNAYRWPPDGAVLRSYSVTLSDQAVDGLLDLHEQYKRLEAQVAELTQKMKAQGDGKRNEREGLRHD